MRRFDVRQARVSRCPRAPGRALAKSAGPSIMCLTRAVWPLGAKVCSSVKRRRTGKPKDGHARLSSKRGRAFSPQPKGAVRCASCRGVRPFVRSWLKRRSARCEPTFMLLPTTRQAHVDAPGPCGGKVARGGLSCVQRALCRRPGDRDRAGHQFEARGLMRTARRAPDQPCSLPPSTARVARSGPKSSALSIDINSAKRVRARLTRLLMVPIAHSQIAAASS
jgi:hypothetical protein